MNYILLIIFLLCGFGANLYAQYPSPPPAPLIYKAPEKAELKEFSDQSEIFQIVFSGDPKISDKSTESEKITEYRVYKQGSNSVVRVIEFKNKIENKKNEIYEIYKNNISAQSKDAYLIGVPFGKIASEKDVKISGLNGKEIGVDANQIFTKIIILISKNKIYELKVDVTNWHILTGYNKPKVEEFNRETERFFNSFKILK